jgi:hypothetical protein
VSGVHREASVSFAILATVAAGALVAGTLLVRKVSSRPDLTAEERVEMTSAPVPGMARRAGWGLLIISVAVAVISGILFTQGAAAYWENDDLRLLVVGIFLAGLLAYVFVVPVMLASDEQRGRLDERDLSILRRSATGQTTTVILTMAAWLTVLPRMFHSEGAVPVVYLYLMFGSVFFGMMLGQALGILVGYWWELRRG